MSADSPRFGLLSLFGEIRDGIRTAGKYHNAVTRGSIPEQLKNTMVNPLTLIESSVSHNPKIDDVLYACNDIYAALYLAMASRLTALDVDAVRVTRTLEKLATDRDPLASIAATESASAAITLGLEAYTDENPGSISSRDQLDKVLPADSLSVGKVLNLNFTENGSNISVPVSIRLNTNIVSHKLMSDIYQANYTDFNLIRNIKGWAVYGEKTLLEALTGLDYVKRQERLHKADVDGLLRSHFRDASKEVGFSLLTGDVAVNRASGVIVLDKANLRSLETAFRGRIDKHRDRQRLMDGTACMLMAVVDQEDDMVTFYLKGIKNAQRLKFSQIKVKSNGSSSVDINQIMGGAMVGTVPSLT